MTYKTVLVYMPNKENAERLVKVAGNIARKFGAHLIGLHITRTIDDYPGMGAAVELSERFSYDQEAYAREVEESFLKETQNEDFVSEWRTESSPSHRFGACVTQHARCADLVIMAQPDPEKDSPDQVNISRKVLENSGRPVLMIPNYGKFDHIGDNILVGWSATREVTRAVHDGMPFLTQGGKTEIFWISKVDTKGNYLEDAAREIAVCLDRHGVKVNLSHFKESNLSIGDELLNKAADSGADLIVSGAYGHSRMYDFMVGATTPHLMKHMTVPVLFSS